MFNLPDLRPLIWFAGFGLLCAVVILVGGTGYGAWWAFHHITIN